MRKMESLLCARSGQSTVEFAVVFPVVIIVAVIAINALLFLGQCAAFDKIARQAVRSVAASPGYGQSLSQSCSWVQQQLEDSFSEENLAVRTAVSGNQDGFALFEATLEYHPTLFGLGLKQEVFGVALPALTHRVGLCVDPYKPGVLL